MYVQVYYYNVYNKCLITWSNILCVASFNFDQQIIYLEVVVKDWYYMYALTLKRQSKVYSQTKIHNINNCFVQLIIL